MKVLIATAMYPTPKDPAFGSFIRTQVQELRKAAVDIELLVLEGRPRKLIYPMGVIQLRHRLANGSIDLVHAHYGYVGMVARTQWKVPVIVTYHGSDLLGTINAQGTRTHFSKFVTAAGQFLAQLVDAVVVQSKQMARKLRRANVYIIPHGIDFEVFRPVEKHRARAILGLDPCKQYLLFGADPQMPVKRFPLAKAVGEHLTKRDAAIELLVVYKETQDRLSLYMNACDALVFPSFQEGSPNIVKQAMACNLPIVSTDVGDVREIIGNTKGCYICSPSVAEFAERLSRVLQLRERTQGREHVRHLACPLVAQKIIEVYEETLKKHAARRAHKAQRISS